MRSLYFSFLIFFSLTCGAELKTIDSLLPLRDELEMTGDNVLVLVDVGGTLLSHKNAALHGENKEWKLEWFRQNYPHLSREEKVELVRILQSSPQIWKLIDEAWPEIIQSAQAKGFKVIAFTKTTVDPSLEGLRGAKLLSHGLKFKDDLPELRGGETFVYQDGVIETDCSFKGIALKEILSQLDWRPKKIIFIDNRLVQIESVEEACQELLIPCETFRYTADEFAPPFNEAIANFQLRVLVEEHRWISEEEALQEMDRSK